MKKQVTRNKRFISVKEKLEYIQKQCPETELFEDLKNLFKCKGYKNVKITHGPNEFGKDLVFFEDNKDYGKEWFAVIVKNKSATQNDFMEGNEIGNQIKLAINNPYIDIEGNEQFISKVFIIINGKVTPNSSTVYNNLNYLTPIIKKQIKIWDYQDLENEITEHSKNSFLDTIEPTLNRFFEKQKRLLSDISDNNNIIGLDIKDIDDIFINVQTTYSKELKSLNKYLSYEEGDIYKNEEIDGAREILNSNKNFIIHGIPTSGKTILLKRIGLKAINQESIKKSGVFYFDLTNFKSTDINFNQLINDQYKELTEGEQISINDFSKIIVLIDSIDFVGQDDQKINILKKIEQFINSDFHIDIQIIVATRDINFIQKNSFLKDFKETELLPFSFSQAASLVKKIIPNNKNKTNNFINALKDSLLNSGIQRTPLALTLMAILYRDDNVDLNELPANIYELYDKFADTYLDRWDTSRGISQQYKYSQTRIIMSFIALEMHKQRINELQENELRTLLTGLRKDYDYDELKDIDNLIEHFKSSEGVFNYNSNNKVFHFFNHYFQEFYASLYIESQEDEILIDSFFDSWWSNAIVFHCGGHPNAFKFHDEIIQKIIPIGSFQKFIYLNQHSRCLQASHAISNNNRNKVVNKLIKEFDSFIREIFQEMENHEDSIFRRMPYVNILNQSKDIFETIFKSKFVFTEETKSIFENILINEADDLSILTKYNLAHFLSFQNNDPFYLELFEEKSKDENPLWDRVLFVDINFLGFKKNFDSNKYKRIKRKMNKKKFLIQDSLNQTFEEKNNNKNSLSLISKGKSKYF